MLTERPSTRNIVLLGGVIVLGFVVVILRLWQLQILQGSELRKISESNRLRVIGVPAPRGIIFDRNGIPLVKNAPYFCVSVIPEEFRPETLSSLAMLLGIPQESIAGKIGGRGQSPFIPVRLKEGLTFQEVSYIEARRSDFPGLFITIEVSRDYIYGSAGSHLIGYLGKPTPEQLKDATFKGVPPDAFVGQWGVERLFDGDLRGTAGQRIIEVDALGREIRLLQEVPPVKGTDITLSMDIALQREAEKAFDGRTGALVALQPETGELLGLVSSPSFDPNSFSTGITPEGWTSLMQDKKLPMLNRAVSSQYPPGSTFKVLMSIAALEEGVMQDGTSVSCSGGINFGKWHFGCWRKGGHGGVSLHRAIVESCDVYFYEVGKRLGIDRIHDYALRFGLGRETGIPLSSEKKGLIPSTAWKMENRKSPWFLGETFVNSIGQGYVATTPAQMAVLTAGIANGGRIYRPLLLKGSAPSLTSQAGVKEETLDLVRRYMYGVVNEPGGTAGGSRSAVTTICGKTGTAQVVGIRKDSKYLSERFRDHAWFIAFAPVEKPEVAMSVLVEHGGHGGSAAAPIAKRAIEAFMLPVEKKMELADVQD